MNMVVEKTRSMLMISCMAIVNKVNLSLIPLFRCFSGFKFSFIVRCIKYFTGK